MSFGKLINKQIDEGIDGIVVCGTTGESATMTLDEKKQTIKFAVDVAKRKGSNNCRNRRKLYAICYRNVKICRKCTEQMHY